MTRRQDENEARWDAFFAVLLVLSLLVTIGLVLRAVWPREAHGADLRLTFTAPSLEALPGGICHPESGVVYTQEPLTDLHHAVVKGWRFSDRDTVSLGQIPLTGREGDSIAFDLWVQDTLRIEGTDSLITGTPAGLVWLEVYDAVGNKQPCQGSLTTFSFEGVWPVTPTPPDPGASGLTGTYHRWVRDANGIRQFAELLGTRTDPTVDYEWGTGSPWPGVVPVDSFCARWGGAFTVPTAGTWTLYVSSEDGFRYWVDGVKVRDNWMLTFEQEISNTLQLAAGQHSIVLEYFANVGHSACHLRWSGPGVDKQAIPSAALSH